MSVAVEPKTRRDQEKMGIALSRLADEDATFQFHTDQNGQTILHGMGESHLAMIVERMMREFGVEAHIGKLQVAYRETIRTGSEAEGKYIRQTGGSGNYGHVKIRMEPGKGFEFINDIKGGAVPNKYIQPIEEGLREALQGGVLAGYEIVDVKVTLFDGSYHQLDSNEMAFRIAASIALKEAARKANPVLLEPVMSLEVVAPEAYIGTVISDLNSRRGRIEGMEHRAGSQVVKAAAPLANLLGYASSILELTRDRANVTMEFKQYEVCPAKWRGGDETYSYA